MHTNHCVSSPGPLGKGMESLDKRSRDRINEAKARARPG